MRPQRGSHKSPWYGCVPVDSPSVYPICSLCHFYHRCPFRLAFPSKNIALPCLIFSSIVPSFNSDNVSSIGPLIMTSAFYMLSGLIMAVIVKEFFYVPREFQYGILIMGGKYSGQRSTIYRCFDVCSDRCYADCNAWMLDHI